MYNNAPVITLKSTFKDDRAKLHGLNPNSTPLPPTEAFFDLLENLFEKAFNSLTGFGCYRLVRNAIRFVPFMSFPEGRDRTIYYKQEYSETKAPA